jgi:transposase
MNVRYRVELNQDERDQLKTIQGGGKHATRKLRRAQILLAADAGETDEGIAANVSVELSTTYRTKRCFVLGNLEAALTEAPRPGAERKPTGKQEALLLPTACSAPPSGRQRWTLKLLTGEIVRLTDHAAHSRETVRRCLTESDLKPCAGTCGAFSKWTAPIWHEWWMCSTSMPGSRIQHTQCSRFSIPQWPRTARVARAVSRMAEEM